MSAACQLYAGGVSTACRWRVNCMPANCMPAACQLYVGCMSVAGVSEGWRKKGLSDGGLSSRTRFACPRGLLLGLEARGRYVGSRRCRVGDNSCVAALGPARGMGHICPLGRFHGGAAGDSMPASSGIWGSFVLSLFIFKVHRLLRARTLCRFVAGISSSSECHRPHSTRSGKQRKIVRY